MNTVDKILPILAGLHMAFAIQLFIKPTPSFAAGRFGELIFTFSEKKEFTYKENQAENTIDLHFHDTSPSELSALNKYDDSVIKRVLIKDLGPSGCKIELKLRDKNLRATIDEFEEPYRVVINIFDYFYKQNVDPKNNLPLVDNPVSNSSPEALKFSSPTPSAPYQSSPDMTDNFTTLEMARKQGLPSIGEQSNQLIPKRKLLQPTPDIMENAQDLAITIQKTGEGRGEEWKAFPYYMYPIQTAVYSGRSQPSGWSKRASQSSMSSAQEMAEFALKMYRFGNEKRALVAYQQVLYKDPSIFEKDALHLWAFAESHLGQANLSLADGYYESLINRFPESPLSRFAYLRRLDIQALKLLENNNGSQLTQLAKPLANLDTLGSGELKAQKVIRLAYWTPPFPNSFQQELPLTSMPILQQMEAVITQVESKRTAFLLASIMLKNSLQPKALWTAKTGLLAGRYFKAYDEQTGKPFYRDLDNLLKEKVSAILIASSSKGAFAQTITTFESLPKNIQSIKNDIEVSWSISEAYRNLGQVELALPFYRVAAKQSEQGLSLFRPLFWQAVIASNLSANLRRSGQRNAASKLRTEANRADRRLGIVWSELNDEEKNNLKVSYKDHFERTLSDPGLLKTPSRIILASWKEALGSNQNIGSDDSNKEWIKNYSPSDDAIRLLRKLIRKFRNLGLNKERREATNLLKQITPDKFQGDKEAQATWTKELINLAEEYRKNNQYLEAGRLYTFTADSAVDWSGRAESLYKGGLLLYRSGKRQEAIDSLTKASQDGDNLFYANLAKERLTQLLP